MSGYWIPEETPVLESMFVTHAPNADEIASDGPVVGIFDSLHNEDSDAIEDALCAGLDALDSIAYRAALARLRAWQLADADYELSEV